MQLNLLKKNNKISNIKKNAIKVGGTQNDPDLALCRMEAGNVAWREINLL